MKFSITNKTEKSALVYVTDDVAGLDALSFTEEERNYISEAMAGEENIITLNRYTKHLFICHVKPKCEAWQTGEKLRKTGSKLAETANKLKQSALHFINSSSFENAALLLAQGAALANYQFLKYKTGGSKKENTLKEISFTKNSISNADLNLLDAWTNAAYKVRTLVNEPLSFLTATQLSKELAALGKEAGFKVTTLDKAAIEKEKMGGLLAVNRGSKQPPTFNILEHKPDKPKNKKPIVLVGKGVVYDTGGLSLKPTPNSMDRMKSDMSGAALVTGAMYAIAKLNLPLHVIALIPATDNRPGEDAYVPGDVIEMMSGATVEVLNTDAEGRMILADALHYAKRFKPALVADFATLTGAASAAVGEHGMVSMGTADEAIKNEFKAAGHRQYERLVEFPLWEEYGEMIKSEVADIKNIGGPTGGAITAGKFLEHFTDYPWMHFDIAGVSFATAKKGYLTTGGTAYGMRMLLDFLNHYQVR